jgi:hypothetical protein
VLLDFRVFLQPKGCAPMAALILVRGGTVEIRPAKRFACCRAGFNTCADGLLYITYEVNRPVSGRKTGDVVNPTKAVLVWETPYWTDVGTPTMAASTSSMPTRTRASRNA